MLIVLVARFRHALSVGVLLGAAACSGGSEDSTGRTSSAIALDGVYKGAANGAYAWSSFHDGTYALWSGSAACAADGADEATCGEAGSFATDADGTTVTLTPNSAAAHVHQLRIDVLASAPLVAATTTKSLRPQVGLVGTGARLVSSDGTASLVADRFSAEDSSGTNDGALVQQVDFRSTTFALLQMCSILLGNPADTKPDVPRPSPPPTVSSCGGGKK